MPDLVPKYLVTVGTRWYLLGLAVAPLYQRVPTSPNSHKHNQDSNSLGGTKDYADPRLIELGVFCCANIWGEFGVPDALPIAAASSCAMSSVCAISSVQIRSMIRTSGDIG